MINAINNQSSGLDLSYMQITDKSLQFRNSLNFSGSDIESISEFSKTLYESKLDLKASAVNQDGDEFNFKLVFSSKDNDKLTASGNYKPGEKKIDVSLKYNFKSETASTGKIKFKAFEAIINIKANITRYAEAKSSGSENRDVINFVRSVISEIMKVSGNADKVQNGEVLDKDDLKGIRSLEDAKISEMVKNLISFALTVAQMYKLQKDSKENESGSYKIAAANNGKEIFPKDVEKITSFDVSIKEKESGTNEDASDRKSDK